METIDRGKLGTMRENFQNSDVNKVAMNAVSKNGINKSAMNYDVERICRHVFSIDLETGSVTDQKQSGRCWMFAALNIMRNKLSNTLDIADVELSENYPMFYDKLEKSNFFFQNIINTCSESIDSRIVNFLLKDPLGDGGQWDMFCNLVKKYGVVPKDAMPETVASSNPKEMNRYLTLKLRQYAKCIREEYENGKTYNELILLKDEMLETIYRMLAISLGLPPEKFNYEVKNRKDEFIRIENVTPIEFYNTYIGIDLDEYVSIINSPTKDKPFNKTYTVKYLGNICEGKPVIHINMDIQEMKRLTIEQLKNGEPVWFGSDADQFVAKKEGILSSDVLDLKQLFQTDFHMTKEDKLDYGESMMNHAMLFTGVNVDKYGKTDRFKVENTWGPKVGNIGYFVMSDEWFDKYTYQVVINKKYISDEILELYKSKPIELQPWDPMGSLTWH